MNLLSHTSKMACPGFNLPAVKACPGYDACLASDCGTGTAICRRCYSQKGRYKWTKVKNALERRWEWWQATAPLERAEVLASAFLKDGGKQYFRAYDSGDLCLSAEDTWLKFADLLPQVTVWVPTRTWILPEKLPELRRLAQHPRIVVRPSAMCFGDKAPGIEGLAAGSTAPKKGEDAALIANWVCPGGCGECRTCWTHPELSVAYDYK